MSAPGWEGILDEDERIIWQGQPRRGVDWMALVDFQTVFGLVFVGFAMFWVTKSADMAQHMREAPWVFRLFPLFGLVFVGIGLNMVIGRHLWAAYVRHGTHYTLTSKAAYIARQPVGKRSLNRYGLDRMEQVTLTDTSPGSVVFGEEVKTYKGDSGETNIVRKPVGFERIDNARAVYRMLRDAQGKP